MNLFFRCRKPKNKIISKLINDYKLKVSFRSNCKEILKNEEMLVTICPSVISVLIFNNSNTELKSSIEDFFYAA